jgi:hypothetical protein
VRSSDLNELLEGLLGSPREGGLERRPEFALEYSAAARHEEGCCTSRVLIRSSSIARA